LLADIADGCKRPSATTASPTKRVPSRPTEPATAPPEATTAPTDATTVATEDTMVPTETATAPAEDGSDSTEPPQRQKDTVQVIQHLLDFRDPI